MLVESIMQIAPYKLLKLMALVSSLRKFFLSQACILILCQDSIAFTEMLWTPFVTPDTCYVQREYSFLMVAGRRMNRASTVSLFANFSGTFSFVCSCNTKPNFSYSGLAAKLEWRLHYRIIFFLAQ
jgi:hypothetical protein